MLLQHDKIQLKKFLDEFTKRFTNFCNKAPILISFKTSPVSVHIYIERTNEIMTFPFDFAIDIKKNINVIRDWLLKTQYPVMVETKTEYIDYTGEEIKVMISQGTDPDIALNMKKINEENIKWRIEKVIARRDELFVRNLSTDEYFRFKLKMPCILFLKKFREKLNVFDAWELFKRKSILLHQLEETNN